MNTNTYSVAATNNQNAVANPQNVVANTQNAVANTQNVVANTQNAVANTQNVVANTQNAVDNTQNVVANTQNVIANMQNAVANTQNAIANTQNAVDNTQNVVANMQNAVANTQNAIANTQNAVDNTQNVVANMQNAVANTQNAIANTQNAVDNTQNVVANTQYFNLHTTFIGYLSKIREVKPKKGEPYISCLVSMLRGSGQSAEYTFVNCNVVGNDANGLVKRCTNASTANKKILISGMISDIYLDFFTYKDGDKKGQSGAILKGRLCRIDSVKVDGELKYTRPKKIDPSIVEESQTF